MSQSRPHHPLASIGSKVIRFVFGKRFRYSGEYWERRYREGSNSGSGSYGRLAEFKAKFLNEFVRDNHVGSVIEFGVGDGNQLSLAEYPKYIGFDISPAAVSMCTRRFQDDPTKSFLLTDAFQGHRAELSISLDVIYHLVEDEVFSIYMQKLFESSEKYVVIYSSNTEDNSIFSVPHIRMREFTRWVEKNATSWMLRSCVPNPFPYDRNNPNQTSFADFFVYERRHSG